MSELLLLDDSAPIRMTGDEVQRLVLKANARQRHCDSNGTAGTLGAAGKKSLGIEISLGMRGIMVLVAPHRWRVSRSPLRHKKNDHSLSAPGHTVPHLSAHPYLHVLRDSQASYPQCLPLIVLVFDANHGDFFWGFGANHGDCFFSFWCQSRGLLF